jgi:hypothetical protein
VYCVSERSLTGPVGIGEEVVKGESESDPNDDLATSWRVEVVDDETGTTIDSSEPATLSQEWWRRDKRGHLTREEDAMLTNGAIRGAIP